MNSPQQHRRHSLRLQGYDYSQAGAYFVTIVTRHRIPIFGEVEDDQVELSDSGRIADDCWQDIPDHFPGVELGAHVIMPSHIHGIIMINTEPVGATHASPLRMSGPKRGSIGAIIGSYKSSVSRRCNHELGIVKIWQRNYYEHVIRNEDDLRRIHEYIESNPVNWLTDEENPDKPR